MLQLLCDKCDAPIALDNLKPGDKVSCPACGDVNVVPAFGATTPSAAAAPRPLDRAAAAGYPPADGPEVNVLTCRPAMLRSRPLSFLLLALVAIGGLAAAATFAWITPLLWLAFTCLGLSGAAWITLGVWKLSTLDEGLIVTTRRTIDREGFFRKHTSEVLHADIRNVEITQTFWQRVWNVGTIGISSAADDRDEVYMERVPRPEQVRRIIDLYRRL